MVLAVPDFFPNFAAKSTTSNMITQIPISLKVDAYILEQLNSECHCSGKKRNHVINEAIRMYCQLSDARRTARALPSTVKPHPAVADFLDFWLPHLNDKPKE